MDRVINVQISIRWGDEDERYSHTVKNKQRRFEASVLSPSAHLGNMSSVC